ncbi:hypothetical protein B0H65DRAFT_506537 [Neurospora tetraspora]|uniref:Uncharacterized protein n=1 Tax=Neurospora tetraspora TaxID=94610 RepID=A0AAE0JKG6_9PEZI|nr:hypothetical protein B0H65DRAFT_506537 [Neurospora tetraspora]
MRTKEILKKLSRRKRGRLNDGGTTDTPSSEDTPSAENDISAEEDPISESAEDASEPQGPVEIVWPTFNRPCRVYSGVIPCESDPMVRRTLCERIKITVGGGGSGGGGHGQQQQQQGQYSGPATTTTTTSRPTKVFFLHKRLLCEYSEYFSTALSPRNRDVFIEAETGHFVFDDDVDDPDDFYRWAVWLYVCSGCKLSPVYEFQHDHRCRPSRLEESSESASESSSESAAAGEGEGEYLSYETYGPYGLPKPPLCMSLSDHIEVGCHHWHRRFDVIAEEEEEGDDARHGGGPEDEDLLRGNCYGDGRSLSSTVTGWFCARNSSSSSSGTGQGSKGVTTSENSANAVISDPNAPLEAAAAYMFGYRILSREYRLFALAHFIQHVDVLTDGYKDELRNLLYEVFPVGSEAHRFLSAWVAWLRFKKRLPLDDDRFDPSVIDYEEGDLETAAFWKMFDRVGSRAGSADPRRYPLFHWEQDCSKEMPGHVDCVHIQSLKWHGSSGEVTGSIAPNPATNTMTGQSSTRSLTAEERWDIFFRLSKAVVLFWAYVLWWLAPVLILFFAADSFAQDTHHLIELYGKILGIVFAVQAPLAAWYRYLGWEWLMGLTMLLGIPKACGSFLWAKHYRAEKRSALGFLSCCSSDLFFGYC